ncbi:Ca2+-dependent phosphoinositide-specific phospholipase C [Parendozoicomonas haliclonae]|uniref:Phosphatidylinositol diacylglycerol-lyase n=1 Tax=Parendozoicomonas haliclonae TaxID=1960125 RepID=A0A1X7AEB8_9GAMM|nr:Ca2+-dependent phosphoinositide-specific phospholipase C [Parendozoicomonas haliclonae]SMA32328.1 hypothetical protein EHSB41UT_00140 [Parendozoicomonas haliclonae]
MKGLWERRVDDRQVSLALGLAILLLLFTTPSQGDRDPKGKSRIEGRWWQSAAIDPRVWNVRFNRVSQVACHNCYEPHLFTDETGEELPFSKTLDHVTAVEIDIWDTYSPLPLSTGMKRDWYVRHGAWGSLYGNHSNCSAPGSLSACLKDINDWSDRNPGHFPVTIFLDKKQRWSQKGQMRQFSDLSWLLKKVFGNKLYKPRHIVSLNDAKQQAPKGWKWPLVKDMAGRIIVVVNGGNFLLDNATRMISPDNSTYNTTIDELSLFLNTAAAFAGPYAYSSKDFSRLPLNMTNTTVFLNTNHSTARQSLFELMEVSRGRQLVRLWNVDDIDFCSYPSLGVSYAAYYDFRNVHCKGYVTVPINRTFRDSESIIPER